jgi:hypothetical protein
MVRPIIRGESYVGEIGKSMKAVELTVSLKDCWRKFAMTLTTVNSGFLTSAIFRGPPLFSSQSCVCAITDFQLARVRSIEIELGQREVRPLTTELSDLPQTHFQRS